MRETSRPLGKMAWLVGVIFFSATTSQAQDAYPRVELFAAYSYGNVQLRKFTVVVPRMNGHGWASSFSFNFHKHFGVTAEFAGQYGTGVVQSFAGWTFDTITLHSPEVDFSSHQFLFGPRFTLRRSRITAFAHTLIGALRTSHSGFDLCPPGFLCDTFGGFSPELETHFSLGLGGGLDISSNNRVSIRLLQFDYVPVRTKGVWLGNLRLQTGIVVKFGGS